MPYSAVIQPRPCPLSQGGNRSSSVAVTSTWVSPNFTKQEPSAYFTTPRSSETARNSSGCRRLGRIGNLSRFAGTSEPADCIGNHRTQVSHAAAVRHALRELAYQESKKLGGQLGRLVRGECERC